MKSNAEMLQTVCDGLGDLREDVVFVGGAVTFLYCENPASERMRPTDDVDCVINMCTYGKYTDFMSKLRAKGFKDDMSDEQASLCRLIYESIKVDIMSTEEGALGFTNKWYRSGINQSITKTLPSGSTVKVLSLPFYLASKIEAYKSRGNGDARFSHDIEDCIAILDSIKNLPSGLESGEDVHKFLKNEFSFLMRDETFTDALHGFFSVSSTITKARVSRILQIMSNYCKL